MFLTGGGCRHGFDFRRLHLFCCAECGGELSLLDARITDDLIDDARLGCKCGGRYLISDGILSPEGSVREEGEFDAVSLLLDFRINSDGSPAVLERPRIHFLRDVGEAFFYMKGQKRIVRVFVFLLFLNLFTGFSLLVPLPYVLNNILVLDPGTLGVIQGSLPAGAIAGAVLLKKSRPLLGHPKYLPVMSCALGVGIILTGIPALFAGTLNSSAVFLLFYCPVMVFIGITISFIDIPLLSMLQLELPEDCRGRVLSLGMSLVKAASPLALLASGWLPKLLPPYMPVFAGGGCLLLLARAYIGPIQQDLDK